MQSDQGRICLDRFIKKLADREHSEILFECGATLGGSIIKAGLVDELIIYTAPRFIGISGRSLLNLPEIDRMSDLIDFTFTDIRMVGEDVRITAKPR